jgi:phosphoribosylaminoimidazole-succinocarboxamide synthase
LACFKDDATAFNAQKRGQIRGKGEVNCRISALLYQYLGNQGIATHYIDQPTATQMRVRAVKIVPLEVVVSQYCRRKFVSANRLALGSSLVRTVGRILFKK